MSDQWYHIPPSVGETGDAVEEPETDQTAGVPLITGVKYKVPISEQMFKEFAGWPDIDAIIHQELLAGLQREEARQMFGSFGGASCSAGRAFPPISKKEKKRIKAADKKRNKKLAPLYKKLVKLEKRIRKHGGDLDYGW